MSNNLCQCGCFLLGPMDGGIQLGNLKHSHNKCGPCNTYGVFIDNETSLVPTLTDAYQQGRDDEHQELLKFVNEVRDVIRKPYDFRSSVELVMRKEMLERLCDQAEGIEYYDEYLQEN